MTYSLLAAGIVAAAWIRALFERRHRWERLFLLLRRAEIGWIFVLLSALVLLGCTQIVLRNFFHSGILWADPMMRHIVLWLGCLGAALATTRLRHINIDVFSRLLPGPFSPTRRFVVYTATAVAAFTLGIAALRLVIDEKAFGEIAFLGIETWWVQTVLPFSFFVISYRSLVNVFLGREPRAMDGSMEPLEP